MFQDNYKKPSNCSPTWTALVSGASLLNKGMRWRIGNGCTAKFGVINGLLVGSWNLPLLYLSLPPEVVDIISAIPISQCDLHDKIMWGGTSSGVFSVKSAYRCKCIFEERFRYPYNFTDVILNYAAEWTKASAKHKVQRVEQVEALSWIKHVLGVHKLNVDGSRTRAGDIGAGGIIRDSSGCWCGGFMVNIGAGEVLQAEAWGLFYGIQLAFSMKIPKLEIEFDSAVLVNLLQNSDMDVHPLGTIVLNCRAMMQHFDFVQIKHIHRERNIVADLLAKNSPLNDKGICIFNEPPDLVTNALLDDIVVVTRCRTVSTNSAG
ncbi:hypothetical protein ACLB2K_022380 [Fragaria x ananassa]